jgi:hypothetical protein
MNEEKFNVNKAIEAMLDDRAENAWMITQEREPSPNGNGNGARLARAEKRLFFFSEIEETMTNWLWYPYIPLGRLTTIEGNPGDGKSWFCLAVASMLSRGEWIGTVAGGTNIETPSHTIYLSCEDGPNDILKPRLRIMEADQGKVSGVKGPHETVDGETFVRLTLAELPDLGDMIRVRNAKLLMIDPVQGFLPKGTDMNKAESTRPVLAGLAALAEQTDCAIVLVRHFGKATRESAMHKAIGSVDFAAAVRSILVVARDTREELPVGTSRHAIVQIKSNGAQTGPPMSFELQRDAFRWMPGTNFQEADLLPQGKQATEDSQSKVDGAVEFLRELLADGQVLSTSVRKLATENGHRWRTIVRAKDELKIKSFKDGPWFWKLP